MRLDHLAMGYTDEELDELQAKQEASQMNVKVQQLKQGQVIRNPSQPNRVLILRDPQPDADGEILFADTDNNPYYLKLNQVVTLSALSADQRES